MAIEKYFTYNEIKFQTEAWEQAIELIKDARLPDAGQIDQVIFSGCGSTYYLSLAAASLFQELSGIPAKAAPASELLFNHKTILTKQNTLLVAISRSGTTTETIKAVDHFKTIGKGEIITISNYEEVLSNLGDYNIIIPKGQEKSVAQTRSFASMYITVVGLAARLAKRKDLLESMTSLPDIGDRLIRDHEKMSQKLGENLDYDRFYFLGSGIRYGLACEVNLKMKEMTLTHSEPFHFLEFRHGPMSMVNKNALIIGLVSEKNLKHEQAVLAEMKALGGNVVSFGESNVDIPFGSGLPEPVRGVLYLPLLQLMAFYRSIAKNNNPDRPKNLEAVVKLDI